MAGAAAAEYGDNLQPLGSYDFDLDPVPEAGGLSPADECRLGQVRMFQEYGLRVGTLVNMQPTEEPPPDWEDDEEIKIEDFGCAALARLAPHATHHHIATRRTAPPSIGCVS